MRRGRRKILTAAALAAVCFLCLKHQTAAQPQTSLSPVPGNVNITPKPDDVKLDDVPPNSRAAIRIRVKDADGKPLTRKRFYLLQKDINAAGVNFAARPRREDFLEGASPELRAWLARHDCDTLYCPEYEAEFETAKETVPELKQAYAAGLKKYKNPRIALRWITVSFPLRNLRAGFYERKKNWTEESALRAGRVASVMTDERGEAYFTGIELKDFYVSNIFPLERGNVLWSALVRVPPLLPGKLHSVTVELTAPAK